MDEFLKTWYGILAFALFDAVALVLIITLTYRWFFKRIFDFLGAIVCLIVCSPLFLIVRIRAGKAVKRGEIQAVYRAEEFIGKKGKKIRLHTFERGEGAYSAWLEKTKLYALPRLVDAFCGRLSFIGYKPLTESECETLTEAQYDRHLTRAGLIYPFSVNGGDLSDEEEMLKADEKYAWNFSFFGDLKIFFSWLLQKIRG